MYFHNCHIYFNIIPHVTLLERMRRLRKRVATTDGLTNLEIEMQRQKRRRLITAKSSNLLPSWYNVANVENVTIECAKYCVSLNQKDLLDSKEVYTVIMKTATDQIKREIDKAGVTMKSVLPFNDDVFRGLAGEERKRYINAYMHENSMFQLHHTKCSKCLSVSMYKEFTADKTLENYTCSDCRSKRTSDFYEHGQNRLLPVWYDDAANVHYELPEELLDLRLGEKLLLQRFSCFVPIVHIRNGVMGLKGHCCCFKQDITEICYTLPRKKVTIIRVVKGIRDKLGNLSETSFLVRRKKVLAALRWLKKHHKWYRDDDQLIICEENLSWMNGEDECEIPGIIDIEEDDTSLPNMELATELYNTDNIMDIAGACNQQT